MSLKTEKLRRNYILLETLVECVCVGGRLGG